MIIGLSDANVTSTSSHIRGLFDGANTTGSEGKSGFPKGRSEPKLAIPANMDFRRGDAPSLGDEITSMVALGEMEWLPFVTRSKASKDTRLKRIFVVETGMLLRLIGDGLTDDKCGQHEQWKFKRYFCVVVLSLFFPMFEKWPVQF
jgi:hypothetical protein